MSRYYNRQGEPISLLEWSSMLSGPNDQRLVEATKVSDDVTVSTVWLGLDHSYGGPPPLIFETMVFGGSLDGDCERYSTEEEALAGHAAMVERARKAAA